MMPECPKTLRINGFEWKLREEAGYLEGKGRWGETRHGKLEIFLDPESVPQQQRETLLHEIIHASVDTVLSHEWKLKEELCGSISRLLWGALTDNPEAVAFIFPGKKS